MVLKDYQLVSYLAVMEDLAGGPSKWLSTGPSGEELLINGVPTMGTNRIEDDDELYHN